MSDGLESTAPKAKHHLLLCAFKRTVINRSSSFLVHYQHLRGYDRDNQKAGGRGQLPLTLRWTYFILGLLLLP